MTGHVEVVLEHYKKYGVRHPSSGKTWLDFQAKRLSSADLKRLNSLRRRFSDRPGTSAQYQAFFNFAAEPLIAREALHRWPAQRAEH